MIYNRFFKYTSQDLFILNKILHERKDKYSIIAFFLKLRSEVQYFNQSGLFFFKSNERLSEESGFSESTIERYVAVLKKKELITIRRRKRKRYITVVDLSRVGNIPPSVIQKGELNPAYKSLTDNCFEWFLLSFIVGKCTIQNNPMFFKKKDICSFFCCSDKTFRRNLLSLEKKELVKRVKILDNQKKERTVIKLTSNFLDYYRIIFKSKEVNQCIEQC